jgi:hypothetical protein
MEERGPALGLQLNMGTGCEVWSKDPELDMSSVPARVIRVAGDGFKLLGSSVGGSVYPKEQVASKKVAKIEAILERVHCLDWSQGELILIRGCVPASPSSRSCSAPALPS